MGLNDMAAPLVYYKAKAEKLAAYERYNYAGAALELATIKERFFELYSQFDPINKIKDTDYEDRDKLCASAYYIIYGKLPDPIIGGVDGR